MATDVIRKGFVKVWTNTSPSTSFVAQDVAMDLSTYDAVLVHFKSSTSSDSFDVLAYGLINGGDYQGLVVTNLAGSNAISMAVRYFDPYTDKVVFDNATVKNTTSTSAGTTTNTRMIPLAVYGIRF